MTQQLILVRGLPGSGKTTYAEKILRKEENWGVMRSHYEADMFFGAEDNYRWNGNLIRFAHEWCFSSTVRSLHLGDGVVIVSNTFVTNREMERYLGLPRFIDNLEIRIYEMPLDDLFPNVHGVSDDKIAARRKMWEDVDLTGLEYRDRIFVEKVKRDNV